ncbi:MAG: hypothetical protein L0338_33335 [Acidobacteria bacterium]|nr:hypothetical protein [Acidobacteriota bacterium]
MLRWRLLEVEVSSIERLNDVQLTNLLKRLLNLEVRSAGIAQRAVEADHFFPASPDSATQLIVVYVRALLVV